MSEFYVESEQMGLTKKIFNFEYQELDFEGVQKDHQFWKNLCKGDPNQLTEEQKKKYEEEQKKKQNSSEVNFLVEKEMIIKDIKNVCSWVYMRFVKKDESEKMVNFPFKYLINRICYTFHKYLEHPNLLDQILEQVIESIMVLTRLMIQLKFDEYLKDKDGFISRHDSEPQQCMPREFHQMVGIIYNLQKVRGHKQVMKYFLHEVKDLETICFFLIWHQDKDTQFWETKQVILLWLSVIILAPFDLTTIDSKVLGYLVDKKDIKEYLLYVGELYLGNNSCRTATCLFISNFFQRPDIQNSNQLSIFIDWCSQEFRVQQQKQNGAVLSGILGVLFEIFKIGQRSELQKHIVKIIEFINLDNQSPISTVRHYQCKLVQRLALVLLKPKVNTWLYQRGRKQIQIVQQNQEKYFQQQQFQGEGENDDNDDVDFDSLESIFDFLMKELKDKDTVVRWSAAKGIGRLVQRLNQELGEEVISWILDQCFQQEETEVSWHGGCLCLAELARRGLLLPSKLARVINYMKKALLYEKVRGQYTIGANVRDSACYICWAFARTYEPELLQQYIEEISQELTKVTLFDKEVNCRRAGAAAFQEHVGRQGIFPYGIQILTEADYFTVGYKTNSYLKVSPFVISFDKYNYSMIEHLANDRLVHIDRKVRQLAAGTLCLVSNLYPEYMINKVLSQLLSYVHSDMIHVRQGGIIGIADILLGLNGKPDLNRALIDNERHKSLFFQSLSANEKKLIKAGEYRQEFEKQYEKIKSVNNIGMISEKMMQEIVGMVDHIEKKRLFRGKGGEHMRVAVCRLIESVGICNIGLQKPQMFRYFKTLEECVQKPIEAIQLAAIKALQNFSYNEQTLEEGQKLIQKFIKFANQGDNVAQTRGYSQALGVMNSKLILNNYQNIKDKLIKNTVILANKQQDDCETRMYSIKALEQIFQIKVNNSDDQVIVKEIEEIIDIYTKTVQDYSIDNRGDIGSIVREQTMESVYRVVQIIDVHQKCALISSECIVKIFKIFLKQLVEKIDRVRLKAGYYIQKIVDKYIIKLQDFQDRDQIIKTFEQNQIQKLVGEVQEQYDKVFDASLLPQEALAQEDFQQSSEIIFYWNMPQSNYKNVLHLLNTVFGESMLEGVCVSIGDLTESNQIASEQAIIDQIQKGVNVEDMLKWFLSILKKHSRSDRQTIPTIKALTVCLEQHQFQENSQIKDSVEQLQTIVWESIKKTKQIQKVIIIILLELLYIGQLVVSICYILNRLSNESLVILRHCLFHEFPKVRQNTSDAFYLYLQTEGDTIYSEDKNEQICDFLTTNSWLETETGKLKDYRTKFNSILELEE